MPTGETASGSQDKTDDNPEPKHEPKKHGRPSNVRKDKITKPKPDHDTEKDDNRTRTHWRKNKNGIFSRPLIETWLEMTKNTRWKKCKILTPRIGTNYDRHT